MCSCHAYQSHLRAFHRLDRIKRQDEEQRVRQLERHAQYALGSISSVGSCMKADSEQAFKATRPFGIPSAS